MKKINRFYIKNRGNKVMINEKVSETLKKRMMAMRSKMECPECGCTIPVYPGRYPTKCPECGASFEEKNAVKNLSSWEQFVKNNAISQTTNIVTDDERFNISAEKVDGKS